MRAVCYARVSTPGQAEGYSLETQREATERLARSLGADEVVHVEDTYTGTALDRPAMNQLRHIVRQGGCELVVAYDPDRFSRDLTDLLIVTREFDRAGVALHFVDFTWEKSPSGRLFLQMRGAIAEFEHALILERTSRGKRKKAAMGRLRTYAQPYGYRFDKVGDELHLEPSEAEWVRRIYTWFVDEQLSTRAIARRLTLLGVPGPRSPYWSPGQVWRILRNHTYTGILLRKDEQPDWRPVLVPAIIPRALWLRAQAALARRSRPRAVAPGVTSLLQGLLRCAVCGRRLRLATTRKGDRAWRYYVCPARSAPPAGDACTLRPVRAEELDRVVWDMVVDLLLDERRWQRYRDDVRRREQRELERRLADTLALGQRIERSRIRLEDAHLLGALPRERLEEHRRRLSQEAEAIRQEVQQLEKAIARLADASWQPFPDRAARTTALSQTPLPWRRRLLEELLERVVLHNDRVEIYGAWYDDQEASPAHSSPSSRAWRSARSPS